MKQKIVFIINNFVVGGVERFIRDVLPHLDRDRFDISVITVWGSGALAATYQSLDIPIYWAGGRTWYSSKNPLLKPYFTIISPVTFVRLLLRLSQIRPNVVMTCLTQADIMGTLAAYLTRVPRRVIRQADAKPLQPVIKWLKQNLAIRLATKIIANSTSTQQFVESYFGVAHDKVVALPNGIDITRFRQFGSDSPVRKDLVVGFLGRLEAIKGPQYFIEAIRLLKGQHHLAPPVMVFGDGSLRSQLTDYVNHWQLANVTFAGQTLDPATSLPAIDILVVPSQSEGFGLIVLEGLAGGKIVVASDLPVVRDLIIDNVNGLLFPMGDATALVRQLVRLLQNPALVDQMRQDIHQWLNSAGRRYDINQVAADYQAQLIG
jgi:glycosyltransferase involved in cell wall biosynthesis